MIISIEVPDDALADHPPGVAALIAGAFVDGVARQVKDKLTHGKVAVENALAEWEIIDPAESCEVLQ